jgi:hypothetical protein
LIYLLFYFSFSNSLFFPFQRIPSHQVVWQLLFFFYFLSSIVSLRLERCHCHITSLLPSAITLSRRLIDIK